MRKWDLADLDARPGVPRPAVAGTQSAAASDEEQVRRAREEGVQQGLAAGRQKTGSGAGAERDELKVLIAGINELMKDFEQSLANDVLSMSLELAKLIVRQSLRVKPELVLSVVREAITSLSGVTDQTVLHLHPADALLLRKLAETDPQIQELPWKLVEDPQLERGGCKLSTPTTEVDATVETRWRRIIASLGRDDAWIDIAI